MSDDGFPPELTLFCDAAFEVNPLPWRVDGVTGETFDVNGRRVPQGCGYNVATVEHLVGRINRLAKAK
jgi:hypothetical protein